MSAVQIPVYSPSLLGVQEMLLKSKVQIMLRAWAELLAQQSSRFWNWLHANFFPFQFPVSWSFPGTLRQGALAVDHRADTCQFHRMDFHPAAGIWRSLCCTTAHQDPKGCYKRKPPCNSCSGNALEKSFQVHRNWT